MSEEIKDNKNADEERKTIEELYNLNWDDLSDEELELADELMNMMLYRDF